MAVRKRDADYRNKQFLCELCIKVEPRRNNFEDNDIAVTRARRLGESFLINALGGRALHGKFIYHEREVRYKRGKLVLRRKTLLHGINQQSFCVSLVAADSNYTGKHTFRLQRVVILYRIRCNATLVFATNFTPVETSKHCSSKCSGTVSSKL